MATTDEKKEEYQLNVPSATQLYMEAVANEENLSTLLVPETVSPAKAYEESKDGYIGVDPMYQNAANETDEPRASEDGPEATLEKLHEDTVFAAPEVDEDESANEETKTSTAKTMMTAEPTTPATPAKHASTTE